MAYNKKSISPVISFTIWCIVFAIICIVGITNVLADTVPGTLTYSSTVEQQLYNTGGDNWVSCSNNSCPLWNSDKSGVPSWLSYTFKSSLKTGYTYFFDISIQFNYSNNSSSSIPVWKLSNYVNEGDNYSGRINRDMISCSNAQLSISNNSEIATWNCSFSPKQDYNDFEFYLWTNKNYNSLSNNGVFTPYNNSTYKLNSYKLSYLDGSTGTLITQNQQIIQQQKEQNESSKGIFGKLKDLFNWLTNKDSADVSSAGNVAGWLPAGPVDSLITLPLTFLTNVNTSLSKTCSPLDIKLPYVEKNIQIPCLNTIFNQITGVNNFWTWVGAISSVVILFRYLLALYDYFDKLTTLQANFISDWGGV